MAAKDICENCAILAGDLHCRVRTAARFRRRRVSFVAGLDPQFQVAAALEALSRGLVPVGGFLTHSGGLR